VAVLLLLGQSLAAESYESLLTKKASNWASEYTPFYSKYFLFYNKFILNSKYWMSHYNGHVLNFNSMIWQIYNIVFAYEKRFWAETVRLKIKFYQIWSWNLYKKHCP